METPSVFANHFHCQILTVMTLQVSMLAISEAVSAQNVEVFTGSSLSKEGI
jgi:hypothetical protein